MNAAQATGEGGRITISANKLTLVGSIEIRISDTGVRYSADMLPHIFEPLFSTKRGQGTGLGLSISRAYLRSPGYSSGHCAKNPPQNRWIAFGAAAHA